MNMNLIVKLLKFCAVGRRGVSWGYMVNIHTFWCRGVSTLINLMSWGVQIVKTNLKDTFQNLKFDAVGCRGCHGVSWGAEG